VIFAREIIKQFIDGSEQPRIGVAQTLILENSTKVASVDLEVAYLEGEETLVIGRNLFPLLGFEIVEVLFIWPQTKVPETKPKAMKQLERPSTVNSDDITVEWKKVLESNILFQKNIRLQSI
jgi:hypothetical protein